MKTPLALRVDAGLLARVDAARGDVSRTRWVERALEAALGEKTPGGLDSSSVGLGVPDAAQAAAETRVPSSASPPAPVAASRAEAFRRATQRRVA